MPEPKTFIKLPRNLPKLTGLIFKDDMPTIIKNFERQMNNFTLELEVMGYGKERIDNAKIQCIHEMIVNGSPAANCLESWLESKDEDEVTFDNVWTAIKERHYGEPYKQHWDNRLNQTYQFDPNKQLLSEYIHKLITYGKRAGRTNTAMATAIRRKLDNSTQTHWDAAYNQTKDISEAHIHIMNNDIGTAARVFEQGEARTGIKRPFEYDGSDVNCISNEQESEKSDVSTITTAKHNEPQKRHKNSPKDNDPCIFHKFNKDHPKYHTYGQCYRTQKSRGIKPQITKKEKKTSTDKKSTCHICGNIGHWMKNCPLLERVKRLQELEKEEKTKTPTTNAVSLEETDTTSSSSGEQTEFSEYDYDSYDIDQCGSELSDNVEQQDEIDKLTSEMEVDTEEGQEPSL